MVAMPLVSEFASGPVRCDGVRFSTLPIANDGAPAVRRTTLSVNASARATAAASTSTCGAPATRDSRDVEDLAFCYLCRDDEDRRTRFD